MELKQFFQQPYDRDKFLNFLRNDLLPDDFRIKIEELDADRKLNKTQEINKLGTVDSLDLKVLEFTCKQKRDPKVTITKEAFSVMEDYGEERALVIFDSAHGNDYRFSLLTISLDLDQKKDQLEYNYSNPRRYSFLLGPNSKTHTPAKMLKDKIQDYDDLKESFSIDVVNKEFYKEIIKQFGELIGGKREISSKTKDFKDGKIQYPINNHKKKREFGVRLIGRLVFLWFLKMKEVDGENQLIPKEILSSNAVKNYKQNENIPNKLSSLNSYYHNVLEPLFFETLRYKKNNRKNIIRNELFDKIPFLNGGLFDPHTDDYYCSGNSDKESNNINLEIPNKWFKKLFELFERYNFTIDESSTIDVELSVDPEMLGRIFENLLAEINPKTKENARKNKGTYYTPREIVDYMVDESLKEYLKDNVSFDVDFIEFLFEFRLTQEEVERDYDECWKEEILAALDDLQILDPACGSGAFPMGVLKKVVYLLQLIDPENEIWFDKKIKPNIDDPMFVDKIKEKNWDFTRKLGLIRDSIYGVDIEPIAVEIAKLRFFLSLIVDENVNKNKKNYDIEPLPNLQFKFVCANTLLSPPEPEEKKQLELSDNKPFQEKLNKQIQKYFSETNPKDKKDIEDKVKKLIDEFVEDQKRIKEQYTNYMEKRNKKKNMEKLQSIQQEAKIWESYKNIFKDDKVKFFDTRYFFPDVNGKFDVLIGNPPWIQSKEMSKERKNIFKNKFNLASGHFDIFNLFIERSHELCDENGILCFITPNRFITNISYSKLRKFLLKNTSIQQLLNLGEDIFENVSMPSAILLVKNNYQEDNLVNFTNNIDGNFNKIDQNKLTENYRCIFPTYISEKHFQILEKINEKSFKLGKVMNNGRGVEIGKKSPAISLEHKEGHKPFLRGEDIGRYIITNQVYIDTSYDDINYKSENLYKGTKILVRKTGKGIKATLDDKFRYVIQVIYIFKLKEKSKISEKFILGVLNSRLLEFWYFNTYGEKDRKTFPHLTQGKVLTFPIPKNFSEYEKLFNNLVDKILNKKQFGENTRILENKIDLMLYKLYKLNFDEIRLVNGNLNKILDRLNISQNYYKEASIKEIYDI